MNSPSIRLFSGCQVNSEIRMYLNQSVLWKHAAIEAPSNPAKMQEVHFHGKDYVGIYLEKKKFTVHELVIIEENIKQQLNYYCPMLHVENIKICVFSQLFIA